MVQRRRAFPFFLAGALALGVAVGCGDSTGPQPASITGKAGDGQSGPTGSQLPIPLSFVVLGANGQPFEGATVTWSVSSGAASLNPSTSTSDAAGTASTIVTLGSTAGTVTISAAVTGLATPVTFSATVLDPCATITPHTFGTTVSGTLATTDCLDLGAYYTDFYSFDVTAQLGITVDLSGNFDTWVDIYRVITDGYAYVGANDDISSTDLNSRLEAIVAPGSYLLGATSAPERATGSYTLSTAARPQTVSGCGEVWVTRGVVIEDSVTVNDCVDTTATGELYSDFLVTIAFAGETLRLTQRSTAMNPYLELYRATSSGLVLDASNDDSSAATTDAFIDFPVATSAVYLVVMTTADTGATGSYSLTIGGTAITSPPAATASLPRVREWAEWVNRARPLPSASRSH